MTISVAKDANRIAALLGTLDSDGVTPIAIVADPTTHTLHAIDDTTGTSKPFVNAERDANRIPTVWATSSADGVTPIPVYTDSTGALLIHST